MRTLRIKIMENQGLRNFFYAMAQMCSGEIQKRIDYFCFINLLTKLLKGINFDIALACCLRGRKVEMPHTCRVELELFRRG